MNPLRHRVLVFAAALIVSLASVSASAAPMLDHLPTFDAFSSRLELTPDQQSKLAPLFEKRSAQLREAKGRLEQATSRQAKRDVLRDAKNAGDEFSRQVESVLTPSQQNKWRDIRKEMRAEAKERIEDASGSRKP
jgi:hypothetical protein